jgi:hypothetical protein
VWARQSAIRCRSGHFDVGLTSLFVPTDLDFLGTEADALRVADPELLPFIAHDRVGFGGALMSSGLTVLLMSLWGWRRGERWVWWSLLIGCVAGTGARAGSPLRHRLHQLRASASRVHPGGRDRAGDDACTSLPHCAIRVVDIDGQMRLTDHAVDALPHDAADLVCSSSVYQPSMR